VATGLAPHAVFLYFTEKKTVLPRTELEAERADERNFADNERLACQTEVFGDVDLEILNPEPVD
jgi:ferredoxin